MVGWDEMWRDRVGEMESGQFVYFKCIFYVYI